MVKSGSGLPIFSTTSTSIFFVSLGRSSTIITGLVFRGSGPGACTNRSSGLVFLGGNMIAGYVMEGYRVETGDVGTILVHNNVFASYIISGGCSG